MTNKHTPTPWHKQGLNIVDNGNGDGCERHLIAELLKPTANSFHGFAAEQEANAAFIVKAVNAYDDLVKALEDAYDEVHNLAVLPDGKTNWELIGVAKKISAALAKAKGE